MNQDSRKLRCIIVDDEPLACDLLSDYIQKVSYLELHGIYDNPVQALSIIKQEAIDLVFLDIQMPELSGLQVAGMLPTDCRVIFITAYPDFALHGFELNAADYLLKPVSFERFLKAVNKLQQTSSAIPDLMSAKTQPAVPSHEQVIFVKTDYQIVKIYLSDILYIEGLKEYVAIHTTDKKIITLQNLKRLEETLPGNRFVRVHKSYIVAIDKIDSISRGRIFIKKAVIPVGESYKELFFASIKDLL